MGHGLRLGGLSGPSRRAPGRVSVVFGWFAAAKAAGCRARTESQGIAVAVNPSESRVNRRIGVVVQSLWSLPWLLVLQLSGLAGVHCRQIPVQCLQLKTDGNLDLGTGGTVTEVRMLQQACPVPRVYAL